MSFKFMRKKSNAATGSASITSPELQVIDNESLKQSSESAPSSSVEHKETYVNMMYPSTAASCSTEAATNQLESPDDDDDTEMMKNRSKKAGRGPFRLKQLNLMKSGSYKLKHVTPPLTELATSPCDEKNHLDRQKSVNSSTRSSRLKKLFMLSRADPSRKRQKDVSLKNLRHVL